MSIPRGDLLTFGSESFRFEQKLYKRLYDWCCKSAGLNPEDASAIDMCRYFLLNKWHYDKSTINAFFERGLVTKDMLYSCVMRGFDMSTEMGFYVVLYD